MSVAELFWRTFGWGSMVWFATTAILIILAQLFLPMAWKLVRANPPHGPAWAHALWYGRTRVFGGIVLFGMLMGALAAGGYLLNNL